ncbi:MAG: hypothetical protein WCK76_13440, partial [Elusimicrobiota bacterium]
MAAIRKFLFAAVLIACFERAAVSKTNMELVVNSMYQSGHGGRQVYDGSGDQALTLYEPVLYINSQIDHNTSVFGSAVFDALSSASGKSFDSKTGASKAAGGGGGESLLGGWQSRVGFDFGVSK